MTQPAVWVAITFRSTADTPPEHAVRNGQTYLFDETRLGAIGSGPANPGILDGVSGFLQVSGTAPNLVREWVMVGVALNTAELRQAVLAIPPAPGWMDLSLAAGSPLRRYRNVITQLVDAGIPAPDAVAAAQAFYRAANDNRTAQIAAGNP